MISDVDQKGRHRPIQVLFLDKRRNDPGIKQVEAEHWRAEMSEVEGQKKQVVLGWRAGKQAGIVERQTVKNTTNLGRPWEKLEA